MMPWLNHMAWCSALWTRHPSQSDSGKDLSLWCDPGLILVFPTLWLKIIRPWHGQYDTQISSIKTCMRMYFRWLGFYVIRSNFVDTTKCVTDQHISVKTLAFSQGRVMFSSDVLVTIHTSVADILTRGVISATNLLGCRNLRILRI